MNKFHIEYRRSCICVSLLLAIHESLSQLSKDLKSLTFVLSNVKHHWQYLVAKAARTWTVVSKRSRASFSELTDINQIIEDNSNTHRFYKWILLPIMEGWVYVDVGFVIVTCAEIQWKTLICMSSKQIKSYMITIKP